MSLQVLFSRELPHQQLPLQHHHGFMFYIPPFIQPHFISPSNLIHCFPEEIDIQAWRQPAHHVGPIWELLLLSGDVSATGETFYDAEFDGRGGWEL